MSNCLFCKISKGEIPSSKVFENELVFAFEDINPLAKKHILFIHKKHTSNVNEMADLNPEQISDVYKAISEFTKTEDAVSSGFRVVTNVGDHAGQTVFHTHFHLLYGERLGQFGS